MSVSVLPNDEHDRRLLAEVRPPDWRNPTPAERYDLVVIGGGTAGLVCAAGAASLGARTAIVEQSMLGGDCLVSGCVPSKALLRAARVVAEAGSGSAIGVHASTRVDFGSVMTRLRARRADLARHDSAARLAALGVDVFFGSATFTDARSAAVDGRTLRFRRAVIATGSRPAMPPIPGVRNVTFLTNESVFSLTEQPRALVILGGGSVGSELAQAFALLGTHVTLIEAEAHLLPREDVDAALVLEKRLAHDGVQLRLGADVKEVATDGDRMCVVCAGGAVLADGLLVATGRTPNVETLSLEAAGVAVGVGGVQVDSTLRTTNPRIYAAGDVCSEFKFTHAADAMARVVVQNALFFGRRRAGALLIPWCTFTLPEIAHVGLQAAEVCDAAADTITVPLAEVDRSSIDEETDGFVRKHHRRGRILGATIVAPHAGELIGTLASVMRRRGTLAELSNLVFPYPTVSAAMRQAGDRFRRSALTPLARAALGQYFKVWRGLRSA